jgi:succinate dehydrogenase hydrophobic anchor subunit
MDRAFFRLADRLPLISGHALRRGWPFLLSWCHRLSGLVLLGFLAAHILTLSSLSDRGAYDAKMRPFAAFPLAILEWLLGLPVIFHALNGGRLILYEGFGVRDDRVMIRWVLSLCSLYMVLLGWGMANGDQSISAPLFWLSVLAAAVCLTWAAAGRFWIRPQALGWRLQRISGALLLVMVPAHMFLTHLSFPVGHDSSVVIGRMQSFLIRGVDLVLLAAALFHGGYGAFSVMGDYVRPKAVRVALGLGMAVLILLLGRVGLGVLVGVGGWSWR